MGLSLLVVPFLPSSGLVFRVGFVIAERYMWNYFMWLVSYYMFAGFYTYQAWVIVYW